MNGNPEALANTKRDLQDAEYFLPIHWLLKSSGEIGYTRKSDLLASMVLSSGLHAGRVLDVGCGDGRGTFDLQTRLGASFQCQGVDFSQRAIAFARLMCADIPFEVQSALDLQFESSAFDLVVAREVVEHIPPTELSGFLQQIRRVLRAGGKLLLTTPSERRKLPAKHFQHFTPARLEKVLRENAFSVLQTRGFGWWPPGWIAPAYRFALGLPMFWRVHVVLGTNETSLSRCDDLLLLASRDN